MSVVGGVIPSRGTEAVNFEVSAGVPWAIDSRLDSSTTFPAQSERSDRERTQDAGQRTATTSI